LEKLESILTIGRVRYGSVKRLGEYIGEKNFEYLTKYELIYVGKSYPDVWRITDKGIKRSKALSNRWSRWIAQALWKLHMLS
jgi:hypothetical protein